MNPLHMIRNLIALARIDVPGATPQLKWFGNRAAPAVPHLQGPGIYFIAPADAFGLVLSPSGSPEAGRAVGFDGTRPAEPEVGEGGLHYLGEWKLFVGLDGKLHLGQKDPDDWVALASLVMERLNAIQAAFDTHTHPVAGVTAGPATVPSSVPVAPIGVLADVASADVRCS